MLAEDTSTYWKAWGKDWLTRQTLLVFWVWKNVYCYLRSLEHVQSRCAGSEQVTRSTVTWKSFGVSRSRAVVGPALLTRAAGGWKAYRVTGKLAQRGVSVGRARLGGCIRRAGQGAGKAGTGVFSSDRHCIHRLSAVAGQCRSFLVRLVVLANQGNQDIVISLRHH